MQDNLTAPPLNPLPPVVWALALPMIAMELVLSLGGAGLAGGPGAVGWRLDAVQRFAFSPELMRAMIEAGQYPWQGVMRLFTYPFVHAAFTHALFAVVILLALGKMVGEIFRWWAVLVVFFGAGLAGAAAYTFLPFIDAPLFGGYPPVYGLIGAFTFLLWVNLAAKGANQFRAFTMIGFLMGIQLLFGLLFGGGWDWVADISGFAAGFLLSFVVSPGGWARVKQKIRQR
ncbi:rhomboid family intramembrane serine protease [Fertoebacter nigrum]|uniref:Rhomboid family intramembrane serine protease n=1 Tax=Fertoeibacter niger TaxID=2656921 RepID=A0A8X8KRD3_9RHOB|nr:rhomboid family intramembrane serine protease [Fertoeibacter niger]NUB45082.1 rhomboid family intramembrane serine protease [Fertoeibacter niger]